MWRMSTESGSGSPVTASLPLCSMNRMAPDANWWCTGWFWTWRKTTNLDSYGITDGSAGLRGDVIRTANNDLIKLYAASLISGLAGAFSSGANGVLGNRVYTNNSSLGMSALQGAVINPAVGGTQSVLDRYAEQIGSSIERDGFFVRVPAGKQFYVYCTEAIDLSKAVVAADDVRLAREDADFAKSSNDLKFGGHAGQPV